ncbi:hypothetical protein L7F22_005576 [Adiantum nelumboides]|nr:hypothetical protein [Adiantum nelumboides]
MMQVMQGSLLEVEAVKTKKQMEEALNAVLDAVCDERQMSDGDLNEDLELQQIENRQDDEPFFLMQKACHTGDQNYIRAKLEVVIDACLLKDETLLYDSMNAKHAVISSQSDIDEETGFSGPAHGLHTSIAVSNDQETCLSESLCDVDAHLECSLGDTGDDVDVFDAQPYVFDVNPDKDYDYGDAYLEEVMDDDQSMTATAYRVCYDDAMEKEIDAIFVMHAETCAIEVERCLNGSVKQFVPMYETCNEVFYDETHKLGGSTKEEDMELMDLLDDALRGFQIPCDKSSEEHLATYDEELMMLLDEAPQEFVPTRETSHAAFVVSNEVMAFNDSMMQIDSLKTIATKFILPIGFGMMGIWDFLLLCYERVCEDALYLKYDLWLPYHPGDYHASYDSWQLQYMPYDPRGYHANYNCWQLLYMPFDPGAY